MRISPLLTDLYELTMMCSYLDNKKTQFASFELFTRKLPRKRNYLVYTGLEDVVKFIENLKFSSSDIDYLYSLKLFPDWFLDFLRDFEFKGNLYSMDEGTVFFQQEPVLRVEAPIYEAQFLETAIMNMVHANSLVSSKAARVYSVSGGRVLSDFSLRRTDGQTAGLRAARSCFITGFNSTSNVLAGKLYGIPVVGTVAHSFIMSFENEENAFRAYAKTFPDKTVLLVDTYDTIEGIRKAIDVAKELESKGHKLVGVRLDSGNLVELSRIARRMLDENDLGYVKIVVSSGLDEYEIEKLLSQSAPVDIFGVGTKVGTSSDSPYIDFVYKLVEFDGKPVMKTSSGKRMYPGRKQVFRQNGQDILTLSDESLDGKPLLSPVITNGKLIKKLPDLKMIRHNFLENLEGLDKQLKDIYHKHIYPVKASPKLKRIYRNVMINILRKNG